MASKVEIWNLALQRVRASAVASESDQSQSATECKAIYDHLRRTVLSMAPWRFATRTIALSLTGTTPDDWAYEYTHPTDALVIREILPMVGGGQNVPVLEPGGYPYRIDHEAVPYEVRVNEAKNAKVIVTDKVDAYCEYTADITAEEVFSPLFADALAYRMAMDLATPLGGDAGRQYRADAEAKFTSSVSAAMAQDGNQRQMGRQRMARSAQARHTFYSGDPYWRYR